MSISLGRFFGYTVHAIDGELGKITDVYFDDKEWKVRYFVVQVGKWMAHETVLLSTVCVLDVVHPKSRIDVSLNCEQVRNSPKFDTADTVTMQMEAEMMNYYRWPVYWTNVGIWGTVPDFGNVKKSPTKIQNKSHLRSTREIIGYYVHAPEKRFGKIDDVIVDKRSWKIDSFVAKTRRWWPSRSVLLKPTSDSSFYWGAGEFKTPMPFYTINKLPSYRSAPT